MPMARLKALTFDVTNTLIKANRTLGHQYSDAARAHGVVADAAALDRVFDVTMAQKKREMPDYGKHHGVSSREWWADVVQRVFINSGHQTSPETLAKISDTLWNHFLDDPQSAWDVLPNVREGLDSLKSHGYRLGVVSNFDASLEPTLRAHDLDRFFEFTVTSEEAGTSKPEPAIFYKALCRFDGLNPGEVAHVGDEPENDYFAPRRVGMQAFLVDSEGHLSSAVMQKVVDRRVVDRRHVVKDLKDVDKALKPE